MEGEEVFIFIIYLALFIFLAGKGKFKRCPSIIIIPIGEPFRKLMVLKSGSALVKSL